MKRCNFLANPLSEVAVLIICVKAPLRLASLDLDTYNQGPLTLSEGLAAEKDILHCEITYNLF